MSKNAESVDLENRDVNFINSHVKVAFEDVLAEPDGTESINCVWEISYLCFNGSKNCCYKFVTAICGIFFAIYWGCEFALVTIHHVWCITPCLRVFTIYMGCAQKFCGSCVMCFLAPVCETFGLAFSRIAVTNMNG